MVGCFTLCNTVCITSLWCSLLLPFCFPKYLHKLEKKNSGEFCIQRMKCQEKISSILSRCKSRTNDKSSSQSEESVSPRNQKHLKGTSLHKTSVNKLSKDGMDGTVENTENVCRCRNCLGYEYGCQHLSPDAKMTSVSKNRGDLNNNHRKYRLYAKLIKESDNLKDTFLHLKCKCDKNNQESGNSVSPPNLSKCSSTNNQ